MKRTLALIAGLLLPAGAAFAEVAIELDGQTINGIESIVYDAGTERFRVQLSGSRPCFGAVVPPPVGLVGLSLGPNDHALANDVVYSASGLTPVLSLTSQIGSLSCLSDALLIDRFEAS